MAEYHFSTTKGDHYRAREDADGRAGLDAEEVRLFREVGADLFDALGGDL